MTAADLCAVLIPHLFPGALLCAALPDTQYTDHHSGEYANAHRIQFNGAGQGL